MSHKPRWSFALRCKAFGDHPRGAGSGGATRVLPPPASLMLPIFVGIENWVKWFGSCSVQDGPGQTVPLLFPLLGVHKLCQRPRNKMLCLPQRDFFFVTKVLDVVVPLGQAPAGFDSVSPFLFPLMLASVLDEGWTCADLHLSRAGLDQQDHNTRWGSTSFIGQPGSTDKAFPGASKSWSLGFSSIWTSKQRTTTWADGPGLASPCNHGLVQV